MKVPRFITGGEKVHGVSGREMKTSHKKLAEQARRYRRGRIRRFLISGQTTSVSLESTRTNHGGDALLRVRIGRAERTIKHHVEDGVTTVTRTDTLHPGMFSATDAPKVARASETTSSKVTQVPNLAQRLILGQEATTDRVGDDTHHGTHASEGFAREWGRHIVNGRRLRRLFGRGKSSPKKRSS